MPPRPEAGPRQCPCGTGKAYDDCCGAVHAGRAQAATAEQLMRSRYSAFVMKDADYLLRSWHSSTRPPDIDFDPKLRWTGLEIVTSTDGSVFHSEGTVEFIARYTEGGRAGAMQEISTFTRENGKWVYVRAL